MHAKEKKISDYGNWVSKKILAITAGLSAAMFGLGWLQGIFLVIGSLFLILFLYFLYARYLFSPAGGNYQERIRNLVLENLDWDGNGRALDVGCGNGPLVIQLADKFSGAQVVGVDTWGAGWDYTQAACEENVAVKGVGARTTFRKASAAALPFPDEYFDAVISNFVFHEVRSVKDKRELVREALRVLKKDGSFAFQDLFLVQPYYGDVDELVAQVHRWGVEQVALRPTNQLDFIPNVLKLPFMVGNIAVLYGRK